MDTSTIIIIALVVLFLVWRMKPVKGVNTIPAHSLKEYMKQSSANKVFIDVRTPSEFKSGHIPGFKNIPLGSDLSSLDKSKEIVVICQSGMRSVQACKQLKKLGYEKVTNVRGGFSAYR